MAFGKKWNKKENTTNTAAYRMKKPQPPEPPPGEEPPLPGPELKSWGMSSMFVKIWEALALGHSREGNGSALHGLSNSSKQVVGTS